MPDVLIGFFVGLPVAAVLYVAVFGGIEWLISRPEKDGIPCYDGFSRTTNEDSCAAAGLDDNRLKIPKLGIS